MCCINETINHNRKEEWEQVGESEWRLPGELIAVVVLSIREDIREEVSRNLKGRGSEDEAGFGFFCRTLTQLPWGTFADEDHPILYLT